MRVLDVPPERLRIKAGPKKVPMKNDPKIILIMVTVNAALNP